MIFRYLTNYEKYWIFHNFLGLIIFFYGSKTDFPVTGVLINYLLCLPSGK